MEISDVHNDEVRTVKILGIKLWWPFPIAYGLHGSAARVFGVPVYGNDNCPKIIDWLHDIFRKISNAKYWLLYRLHPKYQYHIIRTGLKPNYHCEDTLILHGCMAMLCRYVEAFAERASDEDKGKSAEQIIEEFNVELRKPDHENAWGGGCNDQADRQAEALAIYRWWKYEKPKDEKRSEDLLHLLYANKEPIKFVPCPDNPKLSQLVVDEDTPDEATMRKEMHELDEKISNDEQKYLHRLIDIRRSLWT